MWGRITVEVIEVIFVKGNAYVFWGESMTGRSSRSLFNTIITQVIGVRDMLRCGRIVEVIEVIFVKGNTYVF